MEHGQAAALTCWLKRLIYNETDAECIPVLIAVRENSIGLEILMVLDEHKKVGQFMYVWRIKMRRKNN